MKMKKAILVLFIMVGFVPMPDAGGNNMHDAGRIEGVGWKNAPGIFDDAGDKNVADGINTFGHNKVENPGDINDSERVDYLIQVLMEDENGRKRGEAAVSLGKIGDAKALEPLIIALKDNDDRVRVGAAVALGGIGNPEAVDPLIEALNDSVSMVRQLAAFSLGLIGNPLAVDPLIRALDDGDYKVRSSAASSLGELRDPRAVEPLIGSFKRRNGDTYDFELAREDLEVRERSANALGMIGLAAVEPLIEALDHEDRFIRSYSALSLGKIGDIRAVDPLIEALDDEDWTVRNSAVTSLALIGDPRAVGPLIEALNDENEWVRLNAANALEALEMPGAD